MDPHLIRRNCEVHFEIAQFCSSPDGSDPTLPESSSWVLLLLLLLLLPALALNLGLVRYERALAPPLHRTVVNR